MKTVLCLTLAGASLASALDIRIDYTYDTQNFFDTEEKRDAMEAVAAFFGGLIKDNLLAIDEAEFPGNSWTAEFFHPETGDVAGIPGLVVPEDTMIVYVGSRVLAGSTAGVAGPGGSGVSYSDIAWLDRVRARGNSGALGNPALQTDFAPWGGSIAFDSDRTWNFSQNTNQAGTEFIKVAMHEMGDVLGIGTAPSWQNRISGTGQFTGAAVVRSLGTQPYVDLNGAHFDDDGLDDLVSPAFGSFGVNHGNTIPVLMLSSSLDLGTNFDVASDLDLAALIDCGWEIVPPAVMTPVSLGPVAASFDWPSSSFIDYQVQRSTTLASFPVASPVTSGNGGPQSWSDPSPPPQAAFYRLAATPAFLPAAPPAAAPPAIQRAGISPVYVEQALRVVECGVCPGH